MIVERFLQWEKESQVDYVTYRVLRSLICKYIDGDSDALFGKFNQLIRDEHYTLCSIFRNFIEYMGLTKEYQSYNNGH
jgi:hypothetical protein